MKIISNNKLIKRNKRIGEITMIAGLIILAGGMIITLFYQAYFLVAVGCLVVGFIVSQISISLGARFIRSPRPDERLTSALKGLDNKYTLYHYTSAVNHLLLGPSGIWILVTIDTPGNISYDPEKSRWSHSGRNPLMKIFAPQDSLGKPDAEAQANINDLNKFLVKQLGDVETPALNAALVFINPKVSLSAADALYPAMGPDKLKDFIRKQAKSNAVPLNQVKIIQDLLPSEGVEAV